ncbi:MAG: TonB-dependent receptor [Alphaproteobacteria bacterium]|nr:TonB-dependent receptor [Alphaproteobacteria bacterium]
MSPFRLVLLSSAAVGFSVGASAQIVLPDTVVTATRLVTRIEQIASSITVITATDMEARQQRTIADALTGVPGLHVVQSGGIGRQTSVFARGTNSNHTLVLIDGIEVSDASTPNGAFDYGHLTTAAIDRIEILRGPQGTLYGSDAIGGVVNIITKQGKKGMRPTAMAETGSFGTIAGSAQAGGGYGRITYFGSLASLSTNGQSITPARIRALKAGAKEEDDAYANTSGSGRIGVDLGEDRRLNLVGYHIWAMADTDQPIEDPNASARTQQWFGRAELSGGFFDGKLSSALGFGYTRHDRDTRNLADGLANTVQRSNDGSSRTKIDLKNDVYLFRDHVVTVGLETEKEKLADRQVSNFSGFIIQGNSDVDVRDNALYLQDQIQISPDLFAAIGGRVDDHKAFGREFTYRIAPAYLLRDWGSKLKASYGTGFRAPALFERFGFTANSSGGTFRGNANLLPERSEGWEAGFEQDLSGGKFTFGSVYFHNDVENLIETVFTFPNSASRNVRNAELWGFESFIRWSLTTDVDLRLDHTFTRAENAATGDDLLRRPRHKVDADLRYRANDRLSLSLTTLFIGQGRDISGNPNAATQPIYKGSHTLFGLAAAQAITPDVKVFGRVDNLLDRTYETADGLHGYSRGVFLGLGATF